MKTNTIQSFFFNPLTGTMLSTRLWHWVWQHCGAAIYLCGLAPGKEKPPG
jgi:hypothetical protein